MGPVIVEVVTVGTELLLGQIVNSNGASIGSRLAREGHDAHFQVVVGDNLERLVDTLVTAVSRAEAVIITGGIGPTQDDLTREALCRVADVEMVRDEGHADWIRDRVKPAGAAPPENLLRMADLPRGSEALANVNGAALGVALHHQATWLFALPGVPVEMEAMLDRHVLPRLRRAAGVPATLTSRVLKTWGLGESRVAAMLDDLFVGANPSVAFLIKDMEVQVRISAKAETAAAAALLIEPVEAEVRRRLGSAYFGGDRTTVDSRISDALEESRWTIGTVESATLGQVGARVAQAAPERFAGAVVLGAVGEQPPDPVADVMVRVGPIGTDPDPDRRTTRLVSVDVTTPATRLRRDFEFGGDDERVRTFATIAALHQLRLTLGERAQSGAG